MSEFAVDTITRDYKYVLDEELEDIKSGGDMNNPMVMESSKSQLLDGVQRNDSSARALAAASSGQNVNEIIVKIEMKKF